MILATETPGLFEAAVRAASEALTRGEVVALPTETVYGLAANAWDAEAVARIYRVKGRPAENPIIVHVASVEQARESASVWPLEAGLLARAFWPGPLTMVLPKSGRIPSIVTAGGSTVGLRWPSHPFMQAVIRTCGFPLAAPSANPSNALSPTTARHVQRTLGDRINLIVDGGASNVGIESTVLDLTCSPKRVLRPGMIHAESLAEVLGEIVAVRGGEGGGAGNVDSTATSVAGGKDELRSPGMLPKHYAPKAGLRVMSWHDDGELMRGIERGGWRAAECQVIAYGQIPSGEGLAGVSVIPHDPEAYARALYAELHRCDEFGVKHIVVETPPEGPEWRGVADRLARASR